ncbi:hypothetical protein SDJN02_23586, partial [Cucurbita argyrosperma subsp. argyrosperma]
MIPPKRKKWTEAEERTLIDKYGEMVSDGTLAKMKTREKKFRPIANYVNSVHHVHDSLTYPWQWSWKDVSTKVQNMRHQYLLVKQKIKKPESGVENSGGDSKEEYDWMEGVTYWSNFLRYKDVFGDVAVANSSYNDLTVVSSSDRGNVDQFLEVSREMDMLDFPHMGHSGGGNFTAGIDGVDNEVMGLRFEFDGDEAEENFNDNDQLKEDGENSFFCEAVDPKKNILKKKKRKVMKRLEKKAWGFLVNQLGRLKDMEAQYEKREVEREQERRRCECLRFEMEKKWEQKWEEREAQRAEREKVRDELRKQRIQEWEAMEKERVEIERRREEKLNHEREWEERMSKRRLEWKNRIDNMLNQHRAEMNQIQTRMLHEQQNLTGQLLGIISQWTAHPSALSDHTSASNHYLSQMMQNLHHVNGIVHDGTRVETDNQDDQFIVDG